MSSRKKNVTWLGIMLSLFLVLTACEFSEPDLTPNEVHVGCSEADLISAINQANASPGPSVVNLSYCTYTLTEVDHTISYSGLNIHNGLPAISSEITIMGNGAVIEILPDAGEPDFGHFYLDSDGDLEIYDLKITDGSRSFGGAVFNQGGKFLASGVEFVGNTAIVVGSNFVAKGGAIYNEDGTLNVGDSTFSTNHSVGHGGAIYSIKTFGYTGGGTINIEGTDFSENAAVRGGAIFLLNETKGVFLHNSFFDLNNAEILGGALYSKDTDISVFNTDFERNVGFHGGAVYSERSATGVLSRMMIQQSNLTENWAYGNGGAVFSENSNLIVLDSTITWNRANSCAGIQNGGTPGLNIRSGDLKTAVQISSTSEIIGSTFEWNKTAQYFSSIGGGLCHVMGDLLINESAFRHNYSGRYGGGLLILDDLEMIDSQVESNISDNGGGVAVGVVLPGNQWYSGVNVDITGSRFYHNIASKFQSQYGGFGGGLMIFSEGTTNINKTTFERNTASSKGGGIYQAVGDLYLTNSTLSSNYSYGGGIKVHGGQKTVVTGLNHVTVAYSNSGGLVTTESVHLSVYKSLFYDNSGDGDAVLSANTSLNAAGNVIENGPQVLGTKFPAGSPMIGPLTGATHPILPGSPLIDFLSSCGEPVDQRTVLRPQGTGCEPGSYEYNGEDDISTNLPDFPQFEPDLGDSSDNCTPFAGLVPELHTLGLPEDTMNLPVVVRVEGEFPGLDPETTNLLPQYIFNASLGDLQAYQCGPQGFMDRLICMFQMPDHAPGMVLDFALYLNDCDDPVYFRPLVSIPEAGGSCQTNLNKAACKEAGGSYQQVGRAGTYECSCP